MLGKVRGHCRDHRPPGHPALPGLSGPFRPFDTRATHRPRTTSPAAGARVLIRQSRARPRAFSSSSSATPLGLLAPVCPHFAVALPPGAVLAPSPGPTARQVATRPDRGASERRSVPRVQWNSAPIMTSMRRPLSSRLDAFFSHFLPCRLGDNTPWVSGTEFRPCFHSHSYWLSP